MDKTLKPWSVTHRELVVDDRWMTLYADSCVTSHGMTVAPYYVQEGVDWCNVAAFDSEFRLLLVEQYRHGIGEFSLELPAGCVERGESPLEAITRELLEEAGCTVLECHALPPQHPNPARQRIHVHPFVATGATISHQQQPDGPEEIRFAFFPLPEVLGRIDRGEIKAAIHVANILMAVRFLAERRLFALS